MKPKRRKNKRVIWSGYLIVDDTDTGIEFHESRRLAIRTLGDKYDPSYRILKAEIRSIGKPIYWEDQK